MDKNIRERLYVEVYNAEVLENLPKDIVYEKKDKLVLLYRLSRYDKLTNQNWAFVTRKHLELWNVDKETLHRDAWRNTRKKRGPVMVRVDESVNWNCERNLLAPDEKIENLGNQEDELYGIVNRLSANAAVYMFDNEIMRLVAEKLESSFYIIPSSIHDLVICRDVENVNLDEIRAKQMIINRLLIFESWVLSDDIYRYDKETGEITIIPQQQCEQRQEINQ